jgi:hypothetical protein
MAEVANLLLKLQDSRIEQEVWPINELASNYPRSTLPWLLVVEWGNHSDSAAQQLSWVCYWLGLSA